ncbi:fibronectin type-III domain-containing protein 3A [Pyxicephalus adspersus]|uniref:fibronectin type-III domain-containing protein 3A n=1 Tax=Pyxicephalus adspersus TaxID=30357 RepID=UPI003B59F73A
MYVLSMMADHHPPPLENTPLLAADIPLLPTPIVNGEGGQQVILVQVNPGEAFTIRREDGQFQCITGPAQVPMMSPNGSVPPIYVPPGYAQQVIEDNGVRRVVVVPQPPEFHTSGHAVIHRPPPPLPGFIPLPAMMPPPPRHIYSPVSGAGEIASQYTPQYHPTQVYGDLDPLSHGRSGLRDERSSKIHERLQKKLKDRHGSQKEKLNSPPYSPKKSTSPVNESNGIIKGQNSPSLITGQSKNKQKGKNSAQVEAEPPEKDEETKALEAQLSNISKPAVSDIQARSVILTWSPPSSLISEESDGTNNSELYTYEILLSNSGKDGKFKARLLCFYYISGKGCQAFSQCYYGLQKQFRVTKLSPAMGYTFRLAAKNDMGMSGFSEEVLFFTSGSAPTVPASPTLIKAGISWLSIQWTKPSGTPSDEGISYILEMEDETSGYGFKPKYNGDDLTFTVKNLRRSSKYKFRVIAYNAEGKSGPSEVVEFVTCPDRPGPPSKPSVKGKVHAQSFRVVWDSPKDDGGAPVTKYVVEVSEDRNGNIWDTVYSGTAREYLYDHLNPGCVYRLHVYCISEGGQSQPSESLLVQTPAVFPGPCQPPRLQGRPRAREVQLRWAPPAVDGGSPVTCYSLEITTCEGDQREVYQGSELEHTVCGLLPGKIYSFRLRAANKAGFGPFSEKCEITTAPGPPEQCRPPQITCKSATCAFVHWEAPNSNGAEITEYRVEWGGMEGCMQICYCGPGFSYEVKGLSPAIVYYCRVQAVNIAGTGLFSEVVACLTPASVPAAVTNLWGMKEDEIDNPHYSPSTCLAIQWERPCDHGSEITSYSIDYGDKQPVSVGKTTSYILEHLQPDTTYRIRVQALNSLGAGPFSHSVKLKTKPLPPEPPRLECAVYSHQNLKLKWGDGTSKSLPTDSIQYHLLMEDKAERFISLYKGPCHTYKVQRLNESTSYKFRIQACNEAGEGPFSPEYVFTTPKSIPPALKAPRIERINEHTCEVTWESLPPMKGDPVFYILQIMAGKDSDFKQVGITVSGYKSF